MMMTKNTAIVLVQFLGMSKLSSIKGGLSRELLQDAEEHGNKKLELPGYGRLLGKPEPVSHICACVVCENSH